MTAPVVIKMVYYDHGPVIKSIEGKLVSELENRLCLVSPVSRV